MHSLHQSGEHRYQHRERQGRVLDREGTTAAAREIGIGVLAGIVGADTDYAPGSGRDCEGSLRTWKIEGCAWV